MSPEIIGLISIVIMIIFMFMGMWISMAMAVVGFAGYAYLAGLDKALASVATIPYSTVATTNVGAVPLFIFMGTLVATTGISSELYNTAYKWIGQIRGGLAVATVVACAAFAAICGSSMAGAVTMGKVTLPEMKKHLYDDSLATGVVASGGTLGIMIPPSLGFIMYGILTENSVGALFMAGIIPGIILTIAFMGVIIIWCARNPAAGPPGPKTTMGEKIKSLKGTWMMACLFLLVLGGLYFGFFTPTESGAVGVLGALVITAITRRLNWKRFRDAALESGMTTAMILFILIGATVFMRLLAVSQLPTYIANFVGNLEFSRYIILAVIVIFYIVLGMFLEITSAIVFTVPIIYPVIITLGFDPIWFGVLMMVIMEMGLVTPPIGMNVFTLRSVTDVPIDKIYRGVYPFVVAMILIAIIMIIWPELATFIPSHM